MRDKLSLSIPKPCSEKWTAFEKTSEGGYCSACSRVVVDFTTMSDEEIVSYFKSNRSHACGRFRPEQIKQYPISTSKWNLMPRLNMIKASALSIGILFVSKEMSATPRLVATEITESQQTDVTLQVTDNPAKRIKGRCIFAEDGSALPGVNVVIKGTTTGTVTDADGYFELEVNETDILIFMFIGLRTTEYEITSTTKEDFVMSIEMDYDITMMGEVATDEVYSSDKKSSNLWTRIKALF
jgi:hypothetical protein